MLKLITQKHCLKKYPFLDKENSCLTGEQWKEIPGTEGYYEVSDFGRIRSLDRITESKNGRSYHRKGRILAQSIIKYYNQTVGDYVCELVCSVSINGKPYRFGVNRMVYNVFVEPIDDKQNRKLILHMNGDNFDNHVSNLYPATVTDKMKRIYLHKRGHKVSSYISPQAKQLGIERRKKQVSQYDLKGNKVALFTSIKDAATKTGLFESAISASCKRKKMVSTGGYLWQYGNGPLSINTDFYIKFREKGKKAAQQPVTQFSLDGEYLKQYKSISEAAKAVGTAPDNIGHCVNGHVATCAGYIWRKGRQSNNIDISEIKEKIRKHRTATPKPVMQICPQTKRVVNTFVSISAAAKKINTSNSKVISIAANKRNTSVGGYYWRFINNVPGKQQLVFG